LFSVLPISSSLPSLNAKIIDSTGISAGRVGLGRMKTGRMKWNLRCTKDDLRFLAGKNGRVGGRCNKFILPDKSIDFINALRD
jgi:hypothetical protein